MAVWSHLILTFIGRTVELQFGSSLEELSMSCSGSEAELPQAIPASWEAPSIVPHSTQILTVPLDIHVSKKKNPFIV